MVLLDNGNINDVTSWSGLTVSSNNSNIIVNHMYGNNVFCPLTS